MVKIIKNSARCLKCNEEIESTHRHDFAVCSCWIASQGMEGIAVDGGKDYLRRIGTSEDTSIIEMEDGDNE